MPVKKPKAILPLISWDTDDHALVWRLIVEITKPANLKFLCRKLKHENTSGETKASIFQWIGSVLLPELHSIDATATGDRIKGRYEGLAKVYKQHAKRLTITGEGIDPDSEDGTDLQTFRYFIEAGGPNESTPEQAKNIWDDIVSQFPFFPDLHHIWATKPNKNPIAVTTGVGPSGRRTLIMQPLSSSEADHEATEGDDIGLPNSQHQEIQTLQDALNLAQQSFSPEDISFEKENSSSISQERLMKAKEHIQKVTKKQTIEDTLMDIHKANTDAINAHSCEDMILKKHTFLLEEFKAGI
ncbi:hypothetical protein J3A83DRAFT_4526360 [Scleroderma citrinum]